MADGLDGSVDRVVDLLVIGGGVAGLSAAIEGADRGARVLLVEKSAQLGGSALWSGGNLLQLGSEGVEHLAALSFGRTPRPVLEAYAAGLESLRPRLERLGAQTREVDPHMMPSCWPNSPGGQDVRYYFVDGGAPAGPALVDVLTEAVAARGIEVLTGTAMRTLLTGDGAVLGAELETPLGPMVVHATGGTILATGGFEADARSCAAYLPVEPVFPIGSPANTGDGLRAAQRVGAALWHMSTFYGFWCLRVPEHPAAFPLLFFSPAHLIVDGEGRRFHAEIGREAHDVMRSVGDFLPDGPNRPGLPAYLVCDAGLLAAGPLLRFPSVNGYEWSADNGAELAAGWLRAAAGPAELAAQRGMDPSVLGATIARYNAMAAAGADDDFHRPGHSMAPVSTDHLVSVELWPGVATTSGGPQRDGDGRVLAEDGAPIAGLYAAGNTGGVWGHLTEHGGGLTDALVFGAIAAAHATDRARSELVGGEPDRPSRRGRSKQWSG